MYSFIGREKFRMWFAVKQMVFLKAIDYSALSIVTILNGACSVANICLKCELVGVNTEESRAELSGVLLLQYEFRPS